MKEKERREEMDRKQDRLSSSVPQKETRRAFAYVTGRSILLFLLE